MAKASTERGVMGPKEAIALYVGGHKDGDLERTTLNPHQTVGGGTYWLHRWVNGPEVMHLYRWGDLSAHDAAELMVQNYHLASREKKSGK